MPGEIFTMNPDGSGVTRLTNDARWDQSPNWSADGANIAVSRESERPQFGFDLSVLNADGSGERWITPGAYSPAWSPDGTRLAFEGGRGVATVAEDGSDVRTLVETLAQDPDWQPLDPAGDIVVDMQGSPVRAGFGQQLAYTVVVRNRGPTAVTGVTVSDQLPDDVSFVSAVPSQGDCFEAAGAVTCELGTLAGGGSATIDLRVTTRTGERAIVNTASATAAEPDPYTGNNADTVHTAPASYPRPQAATPLRVPLAIAFARCTPSRANRSHAGLPAPSCNPAQSSSEFLLTGTFDSNEALPGFVGSLSMKVVCNPPAPGSFPPCTNAGDQADVELSFEMTDVRHNFGSYADYTGEVEVTSSLRITDRLNGASATEPATVTTLPFSFTAPCTETTDSGMGATCSLTTHADTIAPGTIVEGKRSNWQLGAIEVYDGGEDGVVVSRDNTLFARQGVFIP